MLPPIYVITDVEVNGPIPGQHSMLAFASVACSEHGEVLAEYCVNLEEIAGLHSDPDTMEWWRRNPEAQERISTERVSPSVAIRNYVTWVKSFAGDPIFVAHPLIFDGAWIDWYLRYYDSYSVFKGPFSGETLFAGAGIDIPTFAMATLNWDYRRCRREFYPAWVLGQRAHTHHPMDDARGHADSFFALKRARENSHRSGFV